MLPYGEWWPPWVQRSVAIRTPSPPSIMHCTPFNCTEVYILHRGVYFAQWCIFCTGVYILQRVYILHRGVYFAPTLHCISHSSVKTGRAFTLLPMCNNCLGREFGQEPCPSYPSLCSTSANTLHFHLLFFDTCGRHFSVELTLLYHI